MKLHDAIKSGRPIRQTGKQPFHPPYGQWFTLDEVMADNWEVEYPAVTITASQFWELAANVFGYPDIPDGRTYLMKEFARKLGLE